MKPFLTAPFTYFGGKSAIAAEVWDRFGDVDCYIEPFFGSGAALLGRPNPVGLEVVNDLDCMIVNFWRAVKHDPKMVAKYMVCPAFENDHHAMHIKLAHQRDNLRAGLEGDIDFFDPKFAGWWCCGKSRSISNFCSRTGAWKLTPDHKLERRVGPGIGISRQFFGRLSKAKQFTTVADALVIVNALAGRLASVVVYCGSWINVFGVLLDFQDVNNTAAIFLDPPYTEVAGRTRRLYAEDDLCVGVEVSEWAIAHGNDPKLRIALCGYIGEYKMPDDWAVFRWKTRGGFGVLSASADGVGRRNAKKECIWFNRACMSSKKLSLWD